LISTDYGNDQILNCYTTVHAGQSYAACRPSPDRIHAQPPVLVTFSALMSPTLNNLSWHALLGINRVRRQVPEMTVGYGMGDPARGGMLDVRWHSYTNPVRPGRLCPTYPMWLFRSRQPSLQVRP